MEHNWHGAFAWVILSMSTESLASACFLACTARGAGLSVQQCKYLSCKQPQKWASGSGGQHEPRFHGRPRTCLH